MNTKFETISSTKFRIITIALLLSLIGYGLLPEISNENTALASDGVINYHALLIGSGATASDPNKKLEDLVQNDVIAVRDTLINHGANWSENRITILLNDDVSVTSIDTAIASIGQNMDSDDVFMLFYVGHGTELGLYLYDTDLYSPNHLINQLEASVPVGARKFILLEACLSGVFVEEFENQAIANTSVISSATSEEYTPVFHFRFIEVVGKSLSTYHYINALDGGADADRDGIVTSEEIFSYVDWRIQAGSIGMAHPQLYDSNTSSSFPIVSETRLFTTIPEIHITQPSSHVTVTAGTPVNIQWEDSDSDSNAFVSLARDSDDNETPWNDNSNHSWLALLLPEDPENSGDVFVWDTTTTPPGTYVIWAMIYDADHQERFTRASGKITITAPITVSLSGYVKESSIGLSDVWVSDGTRGDYTDDYGYYEIVDVPAGPYTIVPEKAGYKFTPPHQKVTVALDDVTLPDFIASANPPPPPQGTVEITSGVEDFFNTQEWHDTGTLWVGDSGSGTGHADSLIRFTDFSIVPNQATINNANLSLHLDYMSGETTHTSEIREMLSNWPIGTIPPDPYIKGNNVIDSATYSGSGDVGGRVTFNITDLVIDWTKNGTNNGVLIVPENYFPGYHMHTRFDSSESPDGSLEHPKLIVEYGYPDLTVRQASPDNGNSSPPFCVGQSVDWHIIVTNVGNSNVDKVNIGYYLKKSSTDFSGTPTETDSSELIPSDGGMDDEHELITFNQSHVGTNNYLNLFVDYSDEIWEPEEGNNTSSYGPFTVVNCNTKPSLIGIPDQTLDEDNTLNHAIDLWDYATDAQSTDDELSFVIINSNPLAGVSIENNRYVNINPLQNWNGFANTVLMVIDPHGKSDTDVFRTIVNPVNDIPSINPSVPDQSKSINSPIIIDLTVHEHDIEDNGTSLDWFVTGADNCTVSGGYSDDDILTFTPYADFEGSNTVTLHLVDLEGGEATQDIVLTWTMSNTQPNFSGLPDRFLNEDSNLDNAIDLWTYVNDNETPDSGLNFSINNSPDLNAGVTIDTNRYIDINPTTNWCGETDVEIKVTDPGALWDIDTFHVTVNCINDMPWISPSVPSQSEEIDVPITMNLTIYEHDIEDSGTSLDWYVTGADHVVVSGEYSDGDVLTFTPNTGFEGSDTVTLHLVDSEGEEATQDTTLSWRNSLPLDNKVYLPQVLR